MKDQPPQPQLPQPFGLVPRDLRLAEMGDGEPRGAPDGGHYLTRARSARRRLFADDDEPADEARGAGGSRSNGDNGPRRRLMDEMRVYELYEVDPDDAVGNMVADETAAATRRWNFDFENERPLEGQWQWEKVGDQGASEGDENGLCTCHHCHCDCEEPMEAMCQEPVEPPPTVCHSPQR